MGSPILSTLSKRDLDSASSVYPGERGRPRTPSAGAAKLEKATLASEKRSSVCLRTHRYLVPTKIGRAGGAEGIPDPVWTLKGDFASVSALNNFWHRTTEV